MSTSFEHEIDTNGDGATDLIVRHDEFDVNGDGVVDETRDSITRINPDGSVNRWESHDADGDGNAETRSGETERRNADGTTTTTRSVTEDSDDDGRSDRTTRTTQTNGPGASSKTHEEIDEGCDGDVDVIRDTTVISEPDGWTYSQTEDTDGDGDIDHSVWKRYSDVDGDGAIGPDEWHGVDLWHGERAEQQGMVPSVPADAVAEVAAPAEPAVEVAPPAEPAVEAVAVAEPAVDAPAYEVVDTIGALEVVDVAPEVVFDAALAGDPLSVGVEPIDGLAALEIAPPAELEAFGSNELDLDLVG